jgi:prepilin-type N-terminal cleavage/methylation domain-containing protein
VTAFDSARLRRAAGFTLVEIAVALAIIALLLGMLVVPLGTQMDMQRAADTQRQLDVIREALIGFAVANGRLPCPATPTVATTAAGAGTENKPGANCGITNGVVPWATLGTQETDPWGHRYTYTVTQEFANDAAGGGLSTFLLTDSGGITVRSAIGGITIGSAIPAIVVSHGKNGLGAYTTAGTQLTGAAGDELENANADVNFVSRTNAPDFDDLVTWVSPFVLKGRMVAASRLP